MKIDYAQEYELQEMLKSTSIIIAALKVYAPDVALAESVRREHFARTLGLLEFMRVRQDTIHEILRILDIKPDGDETSNDEENE